MRKKILIVEKSETIRSVAENLLRKNGYEVIGLTDPGKALELIKFTRPDLIMAGSDLKGKDKKLFYENFQANSDLNKIPLLMFVDKGNDSLPFPPEVLISKPIDPKDFLAKVAVFAAPRAGQQEAGGDSSGEGRLNDEFLDSALGVDRLEVVESEDMNRSASIVTKRSSVAQKQDLGLGPTEGVSGSPADSTKVESVMIKDDSSKIVKVESSDKQVDVTASNKIDILDDQYGISDPESMTPGQAETGHDYDWFVDEMKSDAKAGSASSVPVAKATPANEGGVEKFIDEFKKEVEKFQDDDLLDGAGDLLEKQPKSKKSKSDWVDSVENIGKEQVSLFTRQLAYDLAERIAVKITDRLDGEKLLRLIKDEIIAEAKRKKKPGK